MIGEAERGKKKRNMSGNEIRYEFTGWANGFGKETITADRIKMRKMPMIVSELEDIEIIFNPKATILTDKKLKRKAVVKKWSEESDDPEKAFLYAFAKLHGITPRMIDRAIKGAIVQVGEKHEKKTKKTEESVSDNS